MEGYRDESRQLNTLAETYTPPQRAVAINWSVALPLAMTVIITVVLAFPVFYFESQELWDHLWHQDYAARWYMQGVLDPPLPHLGYHVLLIASKIVLPQVDWRWLGMGAMLAIYAVLAVIVYTYLLRSFQAVKTLTRWLTAGLTIVVLYLAPINILTLGGENLYFGYIAANTYHNPTSILLKPIAVAQFLLALYLLAHNRIPLWMLGAAFALSIVGAFVKPNYALAMLPALALITLWRMIHHQPVEWRAILFGYGIINALVLLLQYTVVAGSRGQIYIAPLESIRFTEPSDLAIVLKFPLSIAFPALVAFTNWKAARRSLPLGFAWLAFFVSLLHYYLLNEPEHPYAGNFWWGAQTCLFILIMVSVRFWISNLRWDTLAAQAHSLPSLSLGGLTLFLHAVCGLLWWGAHVYQNVVGYPLRAWW